MKTYSGLALGGPYDGRLLTHHAPVYQVGVMPKVRRLSLSEMIEGGADEEFDVFNYSFYRYVDLKLWIPQAVVDGEMFDYHQYSHPMEYIWKKLVDGYNPVAKR